MTRKKVERFGWYSLLSSYSVFHFKAYGTVGGGPLFMGSLSKLIAFTVKRFSNVQLTLKLARTCNLKVLGPL